MLAVARGTLSPTHGDTHPWPSSQSALGLRFLGLTGLADPIRPTVPAALRECYDAGIRTVMITGDYAGTAQAIARQIGLALPETVMTEPELEAVSDAQLRERVARVNIFARVAPEQKLRLMQAFKANGEIVAMTGDRVNDAPALKAAHIGVAMGKRGSDVAREAASLVLLDDDFTSLVEAVELGRRIFDNIQKATCYIVAVHVPIAGMALLPLLFGWPLVFYPVHIVFLEFVIDPACSIAFEAEPAEPAVMRRPPRPATSRLFDGWLVVASNRTDFCQSLASRDVSRNAASPELRSVVVVGGAVLGLGLAFYVQPMREIFHFAPLNAYQFLISVAAATLGLAGPELYKSLIGTQNGESKPPCVNTWNEDANELHEHG